MSGSKEQLRLATAGPQLLRAERLLPQAELRSLEQEAANPTPKEIAATEIWRKPSCLKVSSVNGSPQTHTHPCWSLFPSEFIPA